MLRLAISSALLAFVEYFFSETLQDNLPVVRAKQLGRSMKKTASCKKTTELPRMSPIRSVIITRTTAKVEILFVNREYDYRLNWATRCPVTS